MAASSGAGPGRVTKKGAGRAFCPPYTGAGRSGDMGLVFVLGHQVVHVGRVGELHLEEPAFAGGILIALLLRIRSAHGGKF